MAASGTFFQKALQTLGRALPAILSRTGLPQKWADALGAHGTFWSGLLLGAGGAFLVGGLVLGGLSGGTLLAPGLLGSALMNGAVAAGAMVVGGVLARAGAQAMGIDLLGAIGKIFGKKKTADKTAAAPPQAAWAADMPSSGALKRAPLAKEFKSAQHRPRIASNIWHRKLIPPQAA
jgi:hypothetical protein